MSSAIAMAIGVPISLGIAVFISEISPPRFGTPIGFIIEILAAIPSIIYGLWALFVFRFWIVDFIERPLYEAFGGTIPLFARTPFGLDIFTAGIVLAIMIIPIISSISREILKAIPNSQRKLHTAWVQPDGKLCGKSYFLMPRPACLELQSLGLAEQLAKQYL